MMSLQESINKHGIKTPIVVKHTKYKVYTLIDGHSRLRCVPNEALVPCVIQGEEGITMIPKREIRIPKR